jgi:hypothetical protein
MFDFEVTTNTKRSPDLIPTDSKAAETTISTEVANQFRAMVAADDAATKKI